MTADGVLKMSDFGLARKLYYEVYHKNGTSTVSVEEWEEGRGRWKVDRGRGGEGRGGEEWGVYHNNLTSVVSGVGRRERRKFMSFTLQHILHVLTIPSYSI